MKKSVLIVLCFLTVIFCRAQPPSFQKIQMSRDDMYETFKQREKKLLGTRLTSFNAVTTDGFPINNELMLGKVYLLAFWNPWCNCFHPKQIDSIATICGKRKDFQVLSVMWDTGKLAEFRSKNNFHLPVAKIATTAMLNELSGGNGIPYFMVIDRNGIVMKAGSMIPFMPDEDLKSYIDKIKELLMM